MGLLHLMWADLWMKYLFLKHEYLIITFLSTGWTLLVGGKVYGNGSRADELHIVPYEALYLNSLAV